MRRTNPLPPCRRSTSTILTRTRGAARSWLGAGVALLLISGSCPLLAAGAPDAFEQANRLYEQGRFADAAAAYETLVRSNAVSPAVYFNLGNAYFKAGEVGRALLNYRHAEALAPRDPDIRANLLFARSAVPGGGLRALGRWTEWLPRLTLNEAALGAAVAIWVWLGLLTLRQLRPAVRKPLRSLTILAGACAAILSANAAATWQARRAVPTAIVVVPEATARLGPVDESAGAFTVRDGRELELLDIKDGWLRVTDANRRLGWLKREEAVVFPPPSAHASRR